MSRQRSSFKVMAHAFAFALAFVLAPLAAGAQPAAEFRLQRVLSIGGDLAPEEAAFMDVAGIGVSAAGEIFVLDGRARSVRVFDGRGRFLRRFGREGGGPGEFRAPTAMWVDEQVGISDLGSHRMSYFSLDGRHLRSEPAALLEETPLLGSVPLRHGQAIGHTPARTTVQAGQGAPQGSMHSAVVVLSPRGADTLLSFHSGSSRWHPRDGAVPSGMMASHAGRGGAYAVLGDSIVATADGYSGEVRWFRVEARGLSPFRTRQLPSRSRPLTDADVRRIERSIRAEGPGLPRRLVIDAPPRISIASQALFSDRGFLWIRNTAEPGHAHVWTVFAPDGEIAFRLSLPAGFDLRLVRGDLLYGSTRTANGSPVVEVHRLVRGG